MKIIRRRRTITIETCAYRRWQTQGKETFFKCPNCGVVSGQDTQLNAADGRTAGLIAGTAAEGEQIDPPAPKCDNAGSACKGGCGHK